MPKQATNSLPIPNAGIHATRRLILATGMSGAGRTSGLKVLEDLGWEVVDNLPLKLVDPLLAIEADSDSSDSALAVGIDSRTLNFDPDRLVAELHRFQQSANLDVTLIFFDCADEVLQNRFTATRRRHPMAADRPVSDGIVQERLLISPVQGRADHIIDTTNLSLPDLRQLVTDYYELATDPGAHISITSFSYRNGLPRNADLVFDVRFLRNPFYDPVLKSQTGMDPAVGDFITGDENWLKSRDALLNLVAAWLPQYLREGKRYLTIAFGCTGGRHRSVFVANLVADHMTENGYRVSLRHRDLPN